jgi:hypothetical protein
MECRGRCDPLMRLSERRPVRETQKLPGGSFTRITKEADGIRSPHWGGARGDAKPSAATAMRYTRERKRCQVACSKTRSGHPVAQLNRGLFALDRNLAGSLLLATCRTIWSTGRNHNAPPAEVVCTGLRRFVCFCADLASVLSGFRRRGTAPGADPRAIELPKLQNALILSAKNLGRYAMKGRQITFFVSPATHLLSRDEQLE